MPLSTSRARLRDLIINFPDEHVPELVQAMNDWFVDLKEWESQDSWEAAFADSRITARQILIPDRGATFEVTNIHDRNVSRPITLDKGGGVYTHHAIPENFLPNSVSGKSLKYVLGLHDLSATLIAPGRSIYGQLKPYAHAQVLFMPVAQQEDLEILAALKDMVKKEMAEEMRFVSMVQFIRANLTRIKLAQADDMHTPYVDVSDPTAEHGKFRYGITGTLLDATKPIGFRKAMAADIEARRRAAYSYKSILNSPKTGGGFHVNEIVIAYRAHESLIFPMFAKWDDNTKTFEVATKNKQKFTLDELGKRKI